jgi:D-lactate dehydratase
MSPPRRAIISITSASAVLHGSHKTGLFISEAMHPYNVFKKAGFEVDFVSETGKYEPDWLSEQSDFLKGDDVTEWQDVKGEFRQKLDNMYKPEEVDADAVSIRGVCDGLGP